MFIMADSSCAPILPKRLGLNQLQTFPSEGRAELCVGVKNCRTVRWFGDDLDKMHLGLRRHLPPPHVNASSPFGDSWIFVTSGLHMLMPAQTLAEEKELSDVGGWLSIPIRTESNCASGSEGFCPDN